MTKRAFLELVSGPLLAPGPRAARGLARGERLTNWAGNLEYGTAKLHAARSLDDVQDVVRAHRRSKVLGSRHCFNTIADSRSHLLSLAPMDEVVSLDARVAP